MDKEFDVAIIGGGINGCGCAADAALRGLSVVLLEQDDLASKTSSSSTKLIHGGLRYLEYYEFRLVRKALTERQRLFKLAPHLVHPQSFVLPYQKYMRPTWFLRLGLFLYDHLSFSNRLPSCRRIKRKDNPHYFNRLKKTMSDGFLFYDGKANDTRLTIENALQAKKHHASIRTYSKVIHCEVIDKLWQLTIQPKKGDIYTIKAKALINAAGPWVEAVEHMTQVKGQQKISLVKGSHIIVPRIYDEEHAYLLQNQDQRIVFVIPYEGFSMIGTTDVPVTHPIDDITISEEETNYLLKLVNTYFKTAISAIDIHYSWSGVRALLAGTGKDAKSLSRDYSYELNQEQAPIVTIYGGKITTYRQLAEEVINQLKPQFPHMKPCTTSKTPLPGAKLADRDFKSYALYAQEKYKWMNPELLTRYLNTYGTNMEEFLEHCTNESSLGKKYSPQLYQVEIDYLVREEWAETIEDILQRRTKLDLITDKISKKSLADFLKKTINLSLLVET